MDIRERGNSGCSTIPDFIYHHPEKFKQPGKKIALTLAGAGQMLDPDTMTGGFAWVETV